MNERRKRVQLTNQQFFQICNELQNKREVFTKECHNLREAIDWVWKTLNIKCSIHAINNAMEATGIQLERKSHKNNILKTGKSNTRTITNALYRLYKKLGEEVPQSLADLYARINEETEQTAQPPVPLKSVVDPKLIPINNK